MAAGEGNGAASRTADAGRSGGDGGGENVGELPVMALVGQLRRQDAFVEAPDTGPWWRVWARACGSGGGACRQLS